MNRKLRVLNVEDSERDSTLLCRHLAQAGYEMEFLRVDTHSAMKEAIESNRWDLILSDFVMPQFDAMAALVLLKEMKQDIPFIIVSGTIGEETAVKAMLAGANDYLMKSHLARLAPAIERELQEAENRRARRLMEAALRQSEDRYRDLVENSNDLICTHDLEGRILSVNEASVRLLGHDKATLLNMNIRDILFPELQDGFDDYIQKLLNNGIAKGFMAVKTRHGEKLLWEYTNTLRTQGVAIPIVRGVAHDITEQRRAENALKASEAELRALFAAMTDVILVIDAEGRHLRIASTNPSLLYKPASDMIGKTFHELFPKEKADFFLRQVQTALSNSGNLRVEYSLNIGGAEFWFDSSVSPMSENSVIWIARDITERKKAEDSIRFQAHLLNTVEQSVIATDLSGHVIYWNQFAEKLYGWTVAEALGRKILELTLAVDAKETASEIMSQLQAGKSWSGEFLVRHKNGRVFPALVTDTPIYNKEGILVGIVGVSVDITERKSAEEEKARLNAEIESQRQRLDNIISNVPGAVWEVFGEPDKLTHQTNFMSNYVEKIAGYSVEEWHSTPNLWLSIVHPDDREETARIAAAGFARGENKTHAFRWIAKDGHTVWVEAHTAIITDDEGRPVGERGVTIDISERKQAEAALREAEEKYRSIFENAVEGIFQSTLNGAIIAANPAMVRILGYESQQDLIESFEDGQDQYYVDPNTRTYVINTLMDKGVIVGYECEVFCKDQSKIWVVENIRAVTDETGAAVYFEGSIEDITERKILEDQFRQAQKMEAIGQLAGGIAHDFNNLLTAITGYSDLSIMKLQDEDPLLRNLEEIRKAGDRAAALTRQLLAFSRKQVLQPKVLDINTIVTDMEKMLRRLIGENIDLQTSLSPDPGHIKADPGQIEQVIMNLVVNARDAMPQGGKLTIQTDNVQFDEEYARQHLGINPGSYLMIAVSDNGEGMDAETQKRIFEPFFTTKEVGKGTGLGLSTVYGIIKQSGGEILVYSEVGVGTTFKIYLPLVSEKLKLNKSGAKEEPLQGTETVLLVEDEELVRALARDVLKVYGYRVLEAENGKVAFQICQQKAEEIHLLISDVIMPEMSGPNLATRLTQLCPEIRVLYMSGYTDRGALHQGILEAGANFIQKPFSPAQLAKRVREVLDQR